MRKKRSIALIFGLTVVVGLLGWPTLPLQLAGRVVEAATHTGLTAPPVQSDARAVTNGKIAFASNRAGNFEIYSMDSDGSSQTRLTNNPAVDSRPAWSPDGQRLVFNSDRDGNTEIYVMNGDGSSQTRLTNNPAVDYAAQWSPDGTKIVFTRYEPSVSLEVYVMNTDGSNQIRLTTSPPSGDSPSWSPDGSKIVFGCDVDICVMNADGSNRVTLAHGDFGLGSGIGYTEPKWSPDGSKITYSAFPSLPDEEAGDPTELFVMNADGSNQQNLTQSPNVNERSPAWSPDGNKLVFSVWYGSDFEGGASNIFTMNRDGSGRMQLTNIPATGNRRPSWQPIPLQFLISEFRLSGPAGTTDEYVEFYNNTDAPLVVQTSDGSAGWALVAHNDNPQPQIICTIPNGTTIPARGHLLAINGNGYSLSMLAAGDISYQTNIHENNGIALFSTAAAGSFDVAHRLDAVGFNNDAAPVPALFREGTGLPVIGTAGGDYSFVRRLATGTPQDTDGNAQDFDLVAPDGGTYGNVAAQLGAPGPENLASPIQRNAQLKASLIDAQQPSTAGPNRVRDTTAGICGGPNCTQGTLTIRRRFTNKTGLPITALRFRVVAITTLRAPNPGGAQADLRVLNVGDEQVTITGGGTVPVTGTAVVQPPAQGLGGGLNTSLVVALPGGALVPNASVSVQFMLGVEAGGSFRFLVNVEAETNGQLLKLGAADRKSGVLARPH